MTRAVAAVAVLLAPLMDGGTGVVLARGVPYVTDSPYDIMMQEPGTPGLAPRYRSPRRTRQHVQPIPTPPPPRLNIGSPPEMIPRPLSTQPPVTILPPTRVMPSTPVAPAIIAPAGRGR
jgi:hypothetical protein